MLVAQWVAAAAFVPTDDAQVLERLPLRAAAQNRDLDRLKAAALAAPRDANAATALANAYYQIARAEGDPRYLGYAQAALKPWWNDAQAPTPVLVARATILQSDHQFERALADLDRALAREPRNGRALLVRATVLTVQGKYAQARAECPKLYGVAPELYVGICVATVDSLTGKAAQAMASLERLMHNAGATPEARAWGASTLGEIAARRGDVTAETQFRAALAIDPRDLYTIGAYSDWLLDNKRPAEVIPLVRNDARVDGLLLRLALAQAATGQPEARATIEILRSRYAASRARGDTVHRREEARFALWLASDPATALRLATENWAVQREPADLRVLAEAAAATNDATAKSTVRQWLAETGLEYPAVDALVAPGPKGRQ
jgi:tetratricopeptide (TPR) repeat protein